MRPRLLFAIGAIAFSVVASGAASAAPIIYGTPVLGVGGSAVTVPGSLYDSDHFGQDSQGNNIAGYGMYIPLRSTGGTYGDINGTGMSSDTCMTTSSSTSCDGGMNAYFKFTPLQAQDTPGPYFVYLQFDDLDLAPFNDPTTPTAFLETLRVLDGSGHELAVFNNDPPLDGSGQYTDPGVPGTWSVNNDNILISYDFSKDGPQKITLYNVYVDSDPFYIELALTAFHEETPTRIYWQNTKEFMSVGIQAWPPELVPVPAALPLFLSGLAAMGFVGARRHKKQKAQNA